MAHRYWRDIVSAAGCLDEREAFEAYIVAEGYDGKHWLQRWPVGDEAQKNRYAKDWVQTAWEAWQKRASLSASRQEGEEWHAVISPSGNEGVMFKSERDAKWTATGLMRTGFGVPVIGDAFRDAYDDTSKFTIVKVCAAAPDQSQEAQGDRHG
jgi:hypothetical protein